MRVPFNYMGGKSYVAEWIISFFDYSSTICYIELFGGVGHILFNKKPHKVEIFNDIDGEIINFFKVLRERHEELEKRLRLIPYSRQIFNEMLKKNPEDLDELERAVRWYYIIKSTYSGKTEEKTWTRGYIKNKALFYHSGIEKFSFLVERIKNVQFENRDYRDILKSVMRSSHASKILIYADPPYMGVNYYKVKWDKKDHLELAELLNSLKSKVVLSYYWFDEIEEWYPKTKWIYFTREIVKRSVITPGKPRATEFLLLNYEPNNLSL